MPIYTAGGTVHIEGPYNEVGRDMYTYAGDTHHHVNSHNVENTTTTGSYNDSSLNKGSQHARVNVQAAPPNVESLREHDEGQFAGEEESESEDQSTTGQPTDVQDDSVPVKNENLKPSIKNNPQKHQHTVFEVIKRYWTSLPSLFHCQKGIEEIS